MVETIDNIRKNYTHLDNAGLRKIGAGDNFLWYQYESVSGDYLLTGCNCSGAVYKSGRRKGTIKYDGTPVRVIVTDDEVREEKERFVRETGKCVECMGRGEVFLSWSVENGTKMAVCRSCKGEGK